MDYKRLEARIREKATHYYGGPRVTIKQMADFIEHAFPQLMITISESYSNTDRKPVGSRIITSPGKGRYGIELKVFKKRIGNPGQTFPGELIFSHDTSQTYRKNNEVAEKIVSLLDRGYIKYGDRKIKI